VRDRHRCVPIAQCFRLQDQRRKLHRAKDYLGEFFRRITRKLGRPQAITATAHKLALIVYHLLSTREAYNESVSSRRDEDTIKPRSIPTPETSRTTGFQLIPVLNG